MLVLKNLLDSRFFFAFFKLLVTLIIMQQVVSLIHYSNKDGKMLYVAGGKAIFCQLIEMPE